MEDFFGDNIVVIFLFFLISVLNYSEIKLLEQRISVVYAVIIILKGLNVISIGMSVFFVLITLFIYIEILTDDEMKLKLVTNVFFKVIDCIYQSVFRFHFLEMCIVLELLQLSYNFQYYSIVSAFYICLSVLMAVITLNKVLSEDMEIANFTELYSKVEEYPIYSVMYDNETFVNARNILVHLEDKNFYTRKGYTVFSYSSAKSIVDRKVKESDGKTSRISVFCGMLKMLIYNMRTHNRGYSTIASQLLRSMAIKKGYSYNWNRKIYEFCYTYLFFASLENYMKRNHTDKLEHFRDYIIYLYFHYVNTFLGPDDLRFTKFLNAFDMAHDKKNSKDIYDLTNEGILVACWGLSKKTKRIINVKNVKQFIPNIDGVEFDCNLIKEMLGHLDKPFYDGQYLK